MGNDAFLSLDTSNGERWNVQFGTANTLSFCNDNDNYYAYHVELENTRFFEKLREICWKNELKKEPECKLENINICTNYRVVDNIDSVENKTDVRGIGIGLRGEYEILCEPLRVSVQEDASEQETSGSEADSEIKPEDNQTIIKSPVDESSEE